MFLKTFFLQILLFVSVIVSAQHEKGDSAAIEIGSDTTQIQVIDDGTAEFPGGIDAMMKFLSRVATYPKEAVELGVSGIVYVQFVVERDGKVTEVTVDKGCHPVLDSAAVAAVQQFPLWIPAKQGAKAVRSMLVLPIQYKLTKKDNRRANRTIARELSRYKRN